MLIPRSKEWKAEETAKKVRAWIIKNRDPYGCVTCRRYVGFRHSLHPRTDACRLGSEL